MADFSLFDVPSYYGGLLGDQGVQDLQKKAMTTGLINAALGYLAQPKNQRYGSALPYIGKALAGGYQAGQETIASGLKDWETQQKVKQLQAQREAVAKVSATNPELGQMLEAYPTAAPGVLEKLYTPKTQKTFTILNDEQAKAYGLPTDRGQKYQLTDAGAQLIGGTEQKEAKGPAYTDMYKNLAITMFGTDNPSELSTDQRKQLDETVRQRSLERPPQVVVTTPRQVFQDEQALRKEYTAVPEVKLFGEVQNSYDTIKNSLSKVSPAGDLAGATKFMKLLDPGSVVRESELGMAMAATGVLDRATNYYNMLKTGQKLNPEQRKDFMDIADTLYRAAESRKQAYDQQYGSIASQNGLNPSNVVRGYKPQGDWSIKEKK